MSTFRVELREGQRVISRGTGFLLGLELLVTAAHVVKALGALQDPQVWALAPWDEPLALELLVLDHAQDLAVLRPRRRPEHAPQFTLRPGPPAVDQEWKGRAFPVFHQEQPFTLSGRLVAVEAQRGAQALQLLVEQDTQADWSGASGTPVLIAGEVAGVITNMTDGAATGWAASCEALRPLVWWASRKCEALNLLQDATAYNKALKAEKPEDLIPLVRALDAALAQRLSRGADGDGLRVLVMAETQELGVHRQQLVDRLSRLPGVARAWPQAAEDGEGDGADLRVLLLGWSARGEAALLGAGTPRIVGALGTPENLDDLPEEDFLAGKRLRKGLDPELKFTTPAQAAEGLARKVGEWIAQNQDRQVVPRAWELAYLRARKLRWTCGALRDLPSVNDRVPDRAQVYVSPRAEMDLAWEDEDGALILGSPSGARPARGEGLERARGEGPRRPHLERVLSQPSLRQVVVEGEAGGGKTVLIEHLAQTLAELHLGGQVPPHRLDLGSLALGADLHPIPITLLASGLAECMAQHHKQKLEPGFATLILAIERELGVCGVQAPRPDLERGVREGRYWVLLDSLDEVPEARDRVELLRLLRGLAQEQPKIRLLLTTRPTPDTGPLPVAAPLQRLRLAELPAEEQALLVAAWCTFWGKDEVYVADLRAALDEVEQRDDDLRLGNPLLLTATLQVYESGRQRLPRSRAELYEAIVGSMCQRRQQLELSPNEKLQLLERLFFEMQVAGGTEWDVEKAADWLCVAPNTCADQRQALALLSALSNDTGLLRAERRGEGARARKVLRPTHRTFQEYLAARRLTRDSRSVQEQTEDLFVARGDKPMRLVDPAWNKVLRFLPGAYAVQSGEKLRSHLGLLWSRAQAGAGPEADALRVHVAVAVAEYVHLIDEGQPLRVQVPVELLAAFRARGRDWPVALRLEGLEALGQLGDPRMQEDPWVRVEGGEFVMGGDGGASFAVSAHRVSIPAVTLCWRPVTVLDYASFVESKVYGDEAWWRETEGRAPWPEPEDWRKQLHHGSRPVTEVSWWEAMAYCRWASQHDRERWGLREGQHISLPTETEWEYVARGREGRIYPWGMVQDAPVHGDLAQAAWSGFEQEGPMHATPVGAFPRGDLGRYVDLAGNVWEWCLDPWRDPNDNVWRDPRRGCRGFDPFVDFLSDHKDLTVDKMGNAGNGAPRVVRGGSWFSGSRLQRCASRVRFRPSGRSDDLGFRIVLRWSSELAP